MNGGMFHCYSGKDLDRYGELEPYPAFEYSASKSEKKISTVVGLFGINETGSGDTIDLAKRLYHFQERVPSRFIPIGQCPYPQLLCISVAGKDRGKIFFWSPPDDGWKREDNTPPTEKFLKPVSDSFSNFWNSLFIHPSVKTYAAKLNLTPAFAPCDTGDIELLERDLKIKLPDDYRAFLLQINGCHFPDFEDENEDERFAAIPADGKHTSGEKFLRVTRLYGIGPRAAFDPTDFHLKARQSAYDFNRRVADNLIAIGDNRSLIRFCMSVSGKDIGSIYMWDGAGYRHSPEDDTIESVYLVAKSFPEFWDSIFLAKDQR